MTTPGGNPPVSPPDPSSPQPPDAPDDAEQTQPRRWGSWGKDDEPRPDWRPEDSTEWERAAQAAAERDSIRSTRPSPPKPGPRPPETKRRYGDDTDGRLTRKRHRSRSSHSRKRRKKRLIRRLVLFGVGGLALLGAIVVGDAYYQAYRIASPLESIRADLASARSSLSHGKLPTGDPFTAATAIASQAAAKVQGTNVLFRLVGRVPFVNRPVLVVRAQVAAARELAASAVDVRTMVLSLLGGKALKGGAGAGEQAPVMHGGTVDTTLLAALTPHLESLISHLQAAAAEIRSIPTIPFYHRLTHIKETAGAETTYDIALARNALVGAKVLPSFLGSDRPKTYFLALQNNSDLRGTGGTVLAYAFIRIDHGKLSLMKSGPISDIDNHATGFRGLKLPDSVTWYLQHASVNPRIANGANYSPDLTQVGPSWAAMVKSGTGMTIDGAIALDPVAIAAALGTHSIKVHSYPDHITGANLVKVVENLQYTLPKDAQSKFPGELVGKAWKVFQNPSPLIRTVQRLGQALREKHIQIWSADPAHEAELHRLLWDGSLSENPGDYLYLVDDKRVANKVDYYSHQKITYDVALQSNGTARSSYSVTLTNDTPANVVHFISGIEHPGINLAMLNLYVPSSANFLKVSPLQAPPGSSPQGFAEHAEGDHLVWTQTIQSTLGHPATLSYQYEVPGAVVKTSTGGHAYQLTIQHQPLVNPPDLTIRVTLPPGAKLASATGWTVSGNVATLHTTLTKDFVARILF